MQSMVVGASLHRPLRQAADAACHLPRYAREDEKHLEKPKKGATPSQNPRIAPLNLDPGLRRDEWPS